MIINKREEKAVDSAEDDTGVCQNSESIKSINQKLVKEFKKLISVSEVQFFNVKNRVRFYEKVFKKADENVKSLVQEKKVRSYDKVYEPPVMFIENRRNIESLIRHYETVFK